MSAAPAPAPSHAHRVLRLRTLLQLLGLWLLAAPGLMAQNYQIVWLETQVTASPGAFTELENNGTDSEVRAGQTVSIRRRFTVRSSLPSGSPVQVSAGFEIYCNPASLGLNKGFDALVEIDDGTTEVLFEELQAGQTFETGSRPLQLRTDAVYNLGVTSSLPGSAAGYVLGAQIWLDPPASKPQPQPVDLPVPGFLEWFRADSAQFAGLADGDPIPGWRPETGSASTPELVQIPGREIVYRRSVPGLNGRPALEFPGGSSHIRNIAKLDFDGVSLFLVCRNIGTGAGQRAVAGMDSNTLLGPWHPSLGSTYPPVIHVNGAWKIHPLDLADWKDPETAVLAVVLDATSVERSYLNGREIDSTQGGAGPMSTAGVGRLAFNGAVGNFPNEWFKGHIAEFLVYRRALTTNETTAINDYLMVKYGLKSAQVLPPEITTQPTNRIVTVGQSASFAVAATGTEPLAYRWRKSGTPLADGGSVSGTTTPVLSLANVQLADAGSYDVIVTNAAGFRISSPATLTVRSPEPTSPRITGVTAKATSELASHGRVATNAVNGVYFDNSFWESVGVNQGFGEDRDPAITFDLQGVFALDRFLIWNSHEHEPAIKRMRVETSLDGVTFTALPGEVALASNGAATGQAVPLLNTVARFVRFDILENFAGATFPVVGNSTIWSLVAIDEVEFYGTATNPPATAPTITLHPAGRTVAAGQSVTFTVAATGTDPLAYRWRKGGVPLANDARISGTDTASLTLASVTTADAGAYDVVVSNAGGSRTSDPATLVVSVPNAPFVTRRLPGAYVPARAFEVVLDAQPGSGTAVYAVADRPPSGWTVSAINENGVWDGRTGEVKFGPFTDGAARSLRYSVLPPAGTRGKQRFAGIASSDGTETPILGAVEIDSSVAHPADANADLRLTIHEATAYGAAWKRDETWPVPPTPIPLNYVTRAGFLWRGGETYRLDPAAGAAPTWWVPDTGVQPGLHGAAPPTPGSASRRVTTDATVAIEVSPASTTAAYAVEERLFPGFTATDLTQGGTFLPGPGVVRWGPFFDAQPRELRYRVLAPSGFSGELALLGQISEDGRSLAIGGQPVVGFGTTAGVPVARASWHGDHLQLVVAGPLNAQAEVEAADSPTGPWTRVTTFTLTQPAQAWTASTEERPTRGFFRVRLWIRSEPESQPGVGSSPR